MYHSATVSRRNDTLSNGTNESVVRGVVVPPNGITSELAEKIREPVPQVSENSSESHQITPAGENPEHTISDHETPIQKVAMLDRESVQGQDQTVPANDLQPETPPIDSVLILSLIHISEPTRPY